jgi:hypothetical protein
MRTPWGGFLINLFVTVRLSYLFAPGVVMSVSISKTALSSLRSDIPRLSVVLAGFCWVLLLSVSIVNFLFHHEESGLQRTIIFLILHAANHCLTLMFTTDNYLRGHVTLDCKSPEPQGFGGQGTLGILVVPTTRVLYVVFLLVNPYYASFSSAREFHCRLDIFPFLIFLQTCSHIVLLGSGSLCCPLTIFAHVYFTLVVKD